MPRLTPIHWKRLECIFKKAGFLYSRTHGDHRVYIREGTIRPLIIPVYNEIDVEIIKSNMRTAGMSREEYFRYLAEC